MEIPAWLWVAFTIGAAATQTLRNAMQRSLTQRLGTIGATHVRFLFGLPFGLLFLLAAWSWVGLDGIHPSWAWGAWALTGAVCQIAGTALMLAAMRERSFVVAIAYVKTEPVQIAVFGLAFLGEALGGLSTTAVLLATLGVMLMSLPARAGAPVASTGAEPAPAHAGGTPAAGAPAEAAAGERRARGLQALRPALLGIASGTMFALSAVGFRGAIVGLGDAAFYVRATVTLAASLAIQTALLSAWLLARQPRVLTEIFRAWRPSLLAGVTGATASQLWFLAFSLQAAAPVRTVALVEILFAQAASRRLFSQRLSRREAAGIALMVAGLLLLINS